MKYDEGCLNIFKSVIRRYDNSKIVISSSWIEICTIETIKSLFSSEVGELVLGATPIFSKPTKYFRPQEVFDYLKQNNAEDAPWVAIDFQKKESASFSLAEPS